MVEMLDVVDDNNEVIDSAAYDEVYSKRLNHRIVHVLIFNEKGEIFLQQRSAKKSFCPGHWVTSAGGHVQKDESYEDAAKRELKEELGIETDLRKVDDSSYDHYRMRKFLEVFRGMWNAEFNYDKEEVSGGRWFTVSDVRDMVKKNQLVHPELAHVIERLYP